MLTNKRAKKILLFCERIDQARVIASLLRENGIKATAVYGSLKRPERSSRIDEFRAGHFEVLISVNILREGIDVPSVDGIIILRRNIKQTDPMFTQIIGRGLRGPASGGTNNCLIWHVL